MFHIWTICAEWLLYGPSPLSWRVSKGPRRVGDARIRNESGNCCRVDKKVFLYRRRLFSQDSTERDQARISVFKILTKKNAANLGLILRARRVIFILLVAVCDNEILWKLILWNIYEPCNITTTTHDKAKKKSSLMIINDYIMRQKCLFFLSALKGVPTLSCRRDVSIEQWIERMPHEENPLSAYNVNKT